MDVFSPPSDPGPLVSFLTQGEARAVEASETGERFAMMDSGIATVLPDLVARAGAASLILPEHERGRLVSAHVPVVLGCSHACTFCIIPSRRGAERSRPVADILTEVRSWWRRA